MIFVLLGVFASNKITVLLGADNEVFDMTKNLSDRAADTLLRQFIMNDVLICFVRNDGNPKLSMSAMLAGSFSNIILDYIFIYPFGRVYSARFGNRFCSDNKYADSVGAFQK